MEGMTFDPATWWLFGILLTALLGIVGALVSRTIFKQIDENRVDIKQVRENYTTQKDHKEAQDAMRREIKEVRTEMRTEIRSMSEDVKEIKENCIRREEFLQSQLKLEGKIDKLMEILVNSSNLKGGV